MAECRGVLLITYPSFADMHMQTLKIKHEKQPGIGVGWVRRGVGGGLAASAAVLMSEEYE